MHHFRHDAYAGAGDDESEGAGINWPQTFVALSVVGVAAWGLWFFLRDKTDAPATPPHTAIPPQDSHSAATPGGILVRAIDPVTGLPLVIPSVPGAPAPSAPKQPLFLVGSPLLLKQGQRYRAKLALSGLEASFASKELVRGKFLANGFANVFASQSLNELPSDWPDSVKQPGSGVWWVEGDWTRATGPVDREPQIAQVWEA